MPGMNAVGTNTEASTSAIPTTGPESSFIAFIAASFGASPSSIWRCTPSTTTIASSTTKRLASTKPNIRRGVKSVRCGKLVNRNDGAGLAIQAADRAVILLAQFDSGKVFHTHDPAIRSFANNDAAEFFRRCQTALCQQCIGVLLITGSRLATALPRRISLALSLDGISN